jgi:8-oxo-dGTP pyrophosphatase MutT (NUDIX family)
MERVMRDGERSFGDAPTRFNIRLTLTARWPPVEQVSTAHCLAFDDEGRIVLAHHVARQWTIPGGHLDPGETVEEALRREAREEAGIEISSPTLIAVERIERIAGPAVSERYTNPAHQTFFAARLVSIDAPTALEECTESRLFAPDEARAAPGWVQDNRELYEAALALATADFQPCEGCGFVYDEATAAAAGAAIRAGAAETAALLTAGDVVGLHRRPNPDVWSAVEYGCHLRDVLLVQRERVLAACHAAPDHPPRPWAMLRDERVDAEGYNDTSPEDAARQLLDAASLFSNVLDRMDDTAWGRTIVYRYPAERERTLRWVAVHTLHEVQHHAIDARASLAG